MRQLTPIGQFIAASFILALVIGSFLWLGYQSRGLRSNVQNYIESQKDYPTFR